jgi:hypothetical protein
MAEALRSPGLRPAGGNHATLKKLIERYRLSIEHFDPYWALHSRRAPVPATPLELILVENSTYHRNHLKRRLYDAGVKSRECELCGQGEEWRGRSMALILDHINGLPTDNRLENLQIVCPNCAATLDTHCGRKNRRDREPRSCLMWAALHSQIHEPPLLLTGLQSPQQKTADAASRDPQGRAPVA